MVIIRVVDVYIYYGKHRALNGTTLEILPREVVAIVGPNGSGKTTLLKTIDGILSPSRGSVYIDNRDIHGYARRELAKIIGYVPQRIDPVTNMMVLDFVLTGRRPYADFSYSKVDVAKAFEALRVVEAEHLVFRKLSQLSGGELQRIIIARALVAEPKVLLLDEPTSNLDPRYQVEILKLIRYLAKERGVAVIMALHDLTHAYRFSDKVVMLKNGDVVVFGLTEDVLTSENIEKVFEVKAKVIKDLKAVVIG
ncbi:MAG: ABC transporter ATP-binding protein [Ignisphaera sp.]|uniref:ABC transporter ATP-binding protein n=1 Tax=Ignisphaera aggregans TaxID=334771 RepID=A0A7J3I6H3_9CREN